MSTGTNQTYQKNGPLRNIIHLPNVLSPTQRCRSNKEKELEDELKLMKDKESKTQEEMRKLKAMVDVTREKRIRCPGGKNKESKRRKICDDENYDVTPLDTMNIQQAIIQYMILNRWIQINNKGWNVWDENNKSVSSKCMKSVEVPSTFTRQNYWKTVLVPRMNESICANRNNRKNDMRQIFLANDNNELILRDNMGQLFTDLLLHEGDEVEELKHEVENFVALVVVDVSVFAGKRKWDTYIKNNKNISPVNYFTAAEIAMTIICVENEWELWEGARILIEESPEKLAYRTAKRAVMSQKKDWKSLYKKEVRKHSTNTNK